MGFPIFQTSLVPDRRWFTQLLLKRKYSDINKLNAPHKVDNLEKRFLVWTGKYKTISEVPPFVGQHVMERARNRMRIRIANYMIAATIVGCAFMAYLGKREVKRGITVQEQNREWHRKIKEEDEKIQGKSE